MNWRPKDYKNPLRDSLDKLDLSHKNHSFRGRELKRRANVYEKAYRDCLEEISKLTDQELIDFWRIIKEV